MVLTGREKLYLRPDPFPLLGGCDPEPDPKTDQQGAILFPA